ncbi:MAG TPA: PEGA domain-containing protein [Vicinamibacterales bacterium]|nr:PEGA domain-containing protein [Vicinamibacterales bacterium]
MATVEDEPRSETARSTRSARRSTPLLIAAIAILSAVGSFGAVRAWLPQARTSAAPAAVVRPTNAVAHIAQRVDAPRDVNRPTTAGRLSVVTDPSGARVDVDGRPRGVSPVVIDGLAATEHRITVTSDGRTAERTIAISKDVMTEVVFSLPRSTAAAPAAAAPATAPVGGWVTIRSAFPVEVLEHDEVVGASDASKIMLAAGTHQVVLRNQNVGFEAPRTINVVAGRVTAVEIDPPKAPVNVNARPWADVLVDGETVGQTPLSSLSLAIGPHQVVFRHPQFGERTERIVVTARGPNRVAVDFNK